MIPFNCNLVSFFARLFGEPSKTSFNTEDIIYHWDRLFLEFQVVFTVSSFVGDSVFKF